MNSAATSWHPPRVVLELVELVLAGALPGLPAVGLASRPATGRLTVQDAEGTPVAVLDGTGAVIAANPFSHPPLRSLRRTSAQVAAQLAGLPGHGPVVAVPVTGPLDRDTVELVRARAAAASARLLWLAVFGSGRGGALPPEGLLRATAALAAAFTASGVPGVVVPVAVPVLQGLPDLVTEVALGYGADAVIDLAADPEVPSGASAGGRAVHPAFDAEVARAARPPHRRGVTVLFTGLSGSGKSTIARDLAERLLDDGRRTVSLLDGDEVRRLLSQGLGFSRADRDLNIRRIGYVATEVTRHGGIAICAPIAPFAQVRAEVRAAVEEVGDLVLVHVATPLAECERRDRKGLYARARRGEIPDFTGISSPYEEPTDADLRIDTTGREVSDCSAIVWRLFERRGYLAPITGADALESCESIE